MPVELLPFRADIWYADTAMQPGAREVLVLLEDCSIAVLRGRDGAPSAAATASPYARTR